MFDEQAYLIALACICLFGGAWWLLENLPDLYRQWKIEQELDREHQRRGRKS